MLTNESGSFISITRACYNTRLPKGKKTTRSLYVIYASVAHAWVGRQPWAKNECIIVKDQVLPGDVNGRKIVHLFIPVDRVPEWLATLNESSITESAQRNHGAVLNVFASYRTGLHDAAMKHVREEAYRHQVKDKGVTITDRVVRNLADQQSTQEVERVRLEAFLTSMRLLGEGCFYWRARDLINYYAEKDWRVFERHILDAHKQIESESNLQRADLHLYKTEILTRRPQVLHDWYLSQYGCLQLAFTYPGGRFDVQVARGYFKKDHSAEFPEQPVLPATKDEGGSYEVTPVTLNSFDLIRHEDQKGEYWFARELMPLLGYLKWQKFAEVIERAKIAAKNAGQDADSMFSQVTQVTQAGNLGNQERQDYCLTRYACYLIAMNGDSNKSQVAAAQTYFAAQTHYAEQVQSGGLVVASSASSAEVEVYSQSGPSALEKATAGAEVNYRSAQALAALRDVVPKHELEMAGLEVIDALRRNREAIENL